MKNFPHQYNDLGKLRTALSSFDALVTAGTDVRSDEVYGYDLARKGVYEFRGLEGGLEERIQFELRKPRSRQGAQTAARETRRTLRALGFVTDSPTWAVTGAGRSVLATQPGSVDERLAWQSALLQLTATSAQGDVSHPVAIFLRLLSEVGSVSHRDASLILEPTDDSNAEFQRTLGLLGQTDESILESTGSSRAQFDNARKILPALAAKVGFVETDEAGNYVLTDDGVDVAANIIGNGGGGAEGPPPVERPRRVARPRPRRGAGVAEVAEGGDVYVPTPAELQMRMQRLRERTARHELAVDHLDGLVEEGLEGIEDPGSFDLVVLKEGIVHLFEVKTLEADARVQARRAIGQLAEYTHFVVPEHWPNAEVRRYVVFDASPSDEVIGFLEAEGIGVLVLTGDGITAGNERAREAPLLLTEE